MHGLEQRLAILLRVLIGKRWVRVLAVGSLGGEIGGNFLLAVASQFETGHGGTSAFRLEGVELTGWGEGYRWWKQSMREMAASLAISGSMWRAIGVARSTLKFCLSRRQCWFALMAVTSRSYLGGTSFTSSPEIESP
jgi:hypothetical protein